MSLKYVGLSHPIKLEWMNLVAEETVRTRDPILVAEHLEDNLNEEIRGSESRRKSVNSLIHIWVRVTESQLDFQQRGLKLFLDANEKERIWLHWGMTLAAYPIFTEVATTTGKLLKLQANVTSGQIHRDVYTRWGERSTLRKAIQSILISMRDWGVLDYDNETRRYAPVKKLSTRKIDIQTWLIESLLHSKTQIPVSQLNENYALFPFKFRLSDIDIAESKTLVVNSNDNYDPLIKLRTVLSARVYL